MGGRFNMGSKNESAYYPGPGTYYNPADTFYVDGYDRAPRIGRGKRPGDRLKKVSLEPCPGDYPIPRNIGEKGTIFARALRNDFYEYDADIEIGPGAYTLKSTVPQLQPHEENM